MYDFKNNEQNKQIFNQMYPHLKFEDFKHSTLWQCIYIMNSYTYEDEIQPISFEGNYEDAFSGPV